MASIPRRCYRNSARFRALAVGVAAIAAIAIAAAVNFHATSASASRAWPPFVLVAGLWLVGRVSAEDGLFDAAGQWTARLPGGPVAMFAGLEVMVAVVTALLNLDTAVVFLTPVVVAAARARGLADRPFVYGAVMMSNSASLLLPGANLTNLLVLGGRPPGGLDFAARMALPWLGAVAVTIAVVFFAHREDLARPAAVPPPPPTPPRPRIGAGLAGVAASAIIALAGPRPALPELLVGLALAGWRLLRGRPASGSLFEPRGLLPLLPVFAATVAIGSLAGSLHAPAALLVQASAPGVAAAGAMTAVALNNLPAAVLLGPHAGLHTGALLIGLDLGPNIAVTGSLSALLWMQAARRSGADVSAAAYSRLGAVVALLTIPAALWLSGALPT